MDKGVSITIEPMRSDHVDEVHAIEMASFAIPWTKDSIRREIEENKLALYFVAMNGGRVAGYAGMWHVVNEGHITNIAVSEDFRRSGIGDMLMKRLTEEAAEREMIGLTLEVRESNQNALRLYEHNGFSPEGLRRNYYEDNGEDAIIMWKYLPHRG